MLIQLLLFVLQAFFGFFVLLLLLRFHMQWLRVSFRNPLGRFVLTLTDRMVMPTRRIVPSALGLDLSSLLLALLLHGVYLLLSFWLIGFSFGDRLGFSPALAALALLGIALMELLNYSIYILMAVIAFVVILSWVNPHAPLAPLFNSLARPFLRPFQRLIPPIAQIDLSPLFLLLTLQVLLILLVYLRSILLPLVE